MPHLHVSTHPLIRSKLTRLRDARTPPPEFRQLVRTLAMLVGWEATAELAVRPTCVQTPLAAAEGCELACPIALVPILRAGLGMTEGLLDLIPDAQVWHIGLYRDEQTLLPQTYYKKIPAHDCQAEILLLDPMLATGGSAVRACELLRESGAKRIRLISLLAAPEGVELMSASMPDVPIYVGGLDRCLNDVGYIVPGLGDAGDRQFDTGGHPA